MSLDPDTITQQLALLAAHRRTLAALLQQLALLGGVSYATPGVLTSIEEARTNIARIKAALREHGVELEDQPNDNAPPPVEPSSLPAAPPPATFTQPNWTVSGSVYNVAGDQRTITTGGGDYAEGSIDKRQGAFVSGGTVQGNVVGTNLGTVTANYYSQQAASLTPALHQLRAPIGDFVGRGREIATLVQALSKAASGGATAAISGVRGMGGIGKSELAYAVAQRLAAQFPDAQLLVELRGAGANPLTPAQALQTVVRAFEREARLPDDLGQLKALYSAVLTTRRVLILADDARDAAQVRPLLPPAGCALLVTSRTRFSLPGMATLDLGTLPPAEAEQLLLELCPRIGQHATLLATLCGYLPLALRVSAGVLETNDTRSVPRYLAQVQVARLKHLRDPDTPDDPQASVEASLDLSYDALDPGARLALCRLSVFPASFDAAAALAVVAMDGDLTEALELLRRRSLLEWDATLQRFSLHDLVRALAAARLADAEAVRLRHARYYARVASFTENALYLKGQALAGLALFDRERVHIDAGWTWARARAGARDADTLLLNYANATTEIGDLRYDKRRERIPQLEAQLAAARRLKHRGQEGAALGNLGIAYVKLGDARQAIDCYAQALVMMREIGDRGGEGAVLGNLGTAYAILSDAPQAIACYEQHLAIARELGDRGGEGAALGNLGSAYYALGDARQAIAFFEQHLVIARELGDLQGQGNALGNLGTAYIVLGDARQAIAFFEQHLAIARELDDRGGQGQALGNLGTAYYTLSDARQAIAFFEQHLAIARELGDRRGEGNALGNLGTAYYTLGDARTAISYNGQRLEIARELGDRGGAGQALGNLGSAYYALGDAHQAIACYEQHLAIAREIGDRQGQGNALGNLGSVYNTLGDPRQAIAFFEQHLAIARELGHRGGEGNALGNLGTAYYTLGDTRQAIACYAQYLAIAREIGDRQGQGNALGNLGTAYYTLGDARQAIAFFEQHLAIAREIGDRRGAGNALGNLGSAYNALGDAHQAIACYEQHLAIAREIGDRGGEASASWNLGLALEQAGLLPRAAELLQGCVDILHAMGHPDAEKRAAYLEHLGQRLAGADSGTVADA